MKVDDDEFKSLLGRLQSFLDAICKERDSSGFRQEINRLCNVKYDATVTYATYNGGSLFDHSGDLNTIYGECLNSLNDHFWVEFFNDYSTYAGDGKPTRDYTLVLQNGYCVSETPGKITILQTKQNKIRDMHGRLG